jgi:hypothetical protein
MPIIASIGCAPRVLRMVTARQQAGAIRREICRDRCRLEAVTVAATGRGHPIVCRAVKVQHQYRQSCVMAIAMMTP